MWLSLLIQRIETILSDLVERSIKLNVVARIHTHIMASYLDT